MRRFDQVVVTSPDDAEALSALAPSAPITVIPNGVDLSYCRQQGEPAEPRTIVFSGKMSYHANVTAALYFVREVLPRIRATDPGARFRIVGSDPPEIVRRLAVSDPLIEVTGYLPDLRPAIGAGTVAICPVTVKVGIQNKILEAMALGVPVVASTQGAAGLLAAPGEDLLVGDGPDELAQHVLRLLRDPTERQRLVRSGRRYVERHHRWESAASILEDLYVSALADRRALAPA
jgi:polysaccharide biosynthesis protein PslH